MKYRSFGKLDWQVSALGFGTMRLPTIGKDEAQVNEQETIRFIRYAIDQGVNYIDTAYTYHDGNSEVAIGKALQGKYRKKVKIATKMPVFMVNNRVDLDRILELQMLRLHTGFIDFYLFHSLTDELWQKVKDLKMLEWAEKQIAKGRIGYLGFSFHDEFNVFKKIIDDYPHWTLCQIQYNYLDQKYQAGKNGLKYASSKGLAVVVMEPLAGGLLAVNPPVEIQSELDKIGKKRKAADWALRWVWNQPEVSVALSGMNEMQQVVENLESANRCGPNSLSERENEALVNAGALYLQCGYIGCTKCRYCSHCPKGIDIPSIFGFLNEFSANRRDLEIQANVRDRFLQTVPSEKRASNCISCGQCEAICPQHLPVRKLLIEATGAFGS